MLPTGTFGDDEQRDGSTTESPESSVAAAAADTPAPAPIPDTSTCTTVTTYICSNSVTSTYCGLLRQYGLEDDLEEAGMLTLFVPYNTAFRFLDFEFEKDLDFDTARDILIFHAAVDAVPRSDLECGGFLTMVNSRETRTYCREDDTYQKGGGNNIEAMPKLLVKDIPVCNGVIHIVDRVLLPYAVPRL